MQQNSNLKFKPEYARLFVYIYIFIIYKYTWRNIMKQIMKLNYVIIVPV